MLKPIVSFLILTGPMVSFSEGRPVTFPELQNVSGEYKKVGQADCRDLAHVEADPFTGLLSVYTYTSNPSLCVFADQVAKNHWYFAAEGALVARYSAKPNLSVVSKSRTDTVDEVILLQDNGIHIDIEIDGNNVDYIGRRRLEKSYKYQKL